jgi:DNA-binding transcriptional MerR regulator
VLRCLHDTGMPIAQMRRYAELTRRGQATLAERLSLLTEHDMQVQERIALLQAQHRYPAAIGRRPGGSACIRPRPRAPLN